MLTAEDFWALVDMTGDCWLWTGDHATTQGGYVHLSWSCLPDRYVHRAAWIMLRGPIPPGLTVDHVACRTPKCCNPDHMELVTQGENTRRRPSHGRCRKGHEMTPENSTRNGGGNLICKECRREYRRRLRHHG